MESLPEEVLTYAILLGYGAYGSAVWITVEKVVEEVVQHYVEQYVEKGVCALACRPPPPPEFNPNLCALTGLPEYCIPADHRTSQTATNYDPNALIGPSGYAVENYVVENNRFGYEIMFQNETNATAPAQQVVVTDPLSTNLDSSTFQLTSISFGDYFIAVPPNSQYFQTNLPVTVNGTSFDVDIQAGIDLATGQVFARFYSIDPATGLPPSVEAGFLPPENGTGRGTATVSYTVKPSSGLPTGTRITNVASIRFGLNPIITTDQVDDNDPSKGISTNKQALVTIDDSPPSSAVQPLPPTETTTNFTVAWSGTDTGSGIASYNVYVQTNGGPWALWLAGTAETSAVFNGQDGNTYSFYSAAQDHAGNVEAPHSSADATTLVLAASLFAAVDFSGQANFTWVSHPETDPDGKTAIYMPGGPVGRVTLGGVPFNIKSNAETNEAWNAWMNGLVGQTNLTIPLGVYGVTNVDTLINAYWEASSGSKDAWLIFTGSDGAAYTNYLASGVDVRNWQGGAINGTTTVTVYTNAGGTGYLDMQSIALPSEFGSQTLTNIELVDNGAPGVQRVILDGMTVASVAPVQTAVIDVSASPTAGGTVTGEGTFTADSQHTVVALANPGFEFVDWTEGGTEVSTNASYTFSVGGDRTLVANFAQGGQVCPADTDANFRIVISEVTAYGAAWKRGDIWPNPPNPIPISYVTRVGYLWKNGECYGFDQSQNPPLWWVLQPCPSMAGGAGAQTAGLGSGAGAAEVNRVGASSVVRSVDGATVSLQATPDASVSVHAVEEDLAAGLTPYNITDGGTWDAANRKVKWGPFFDDTARTLSYSVSGVAGVYPLSGVGSYDGVDLATTGAASIELEPTLRLSGLGIGPSGQGLTFTFSSEVGRQYYIECTDNLSQAQWQVVAGPLSGTGHPIRWTDDGSKTGGGPPASGPRFYRVLSSP